MDDGAIVNATIARESMDIGEPERVKFLKAVWMSVQGVSGQVIRVRVAGQLAPQDPIVWGPYLDYTIGSGQRKVDVAAMGRFLSVEISTDNGAEAAFRVPEITMEVELAGLF